MGRVRSVVGSLDEDWRKLRNVSGLSSGEGLIWAVRDPGLGREHEIGHDAHSTAQEPCHAS
jgi:hypothetical protein